ncbi:MAG: hypothetical protein HYZ18_06550 [Pseudogulbenkiania sp.]|nr:hypothetical protein [Pseudogulbenkiania sp.]
MQTCECYYRDDAGRLWLAETFMDDEGATSTTQTLVEEDSEEAPQPAG